MFRILHWSDSHNFVVGANNTNLIIENLPDIDACVHTGDVNQAFFEDSISYANLQNSLFVLGNHETILLAGKDPNGHHWDMQPTPSQLYNKYFFPYRDNTKVTINVNDTWWYKMYPEKNICLVGINSCALGDEKVRQETWLNNILNTCIAESLKVVIVAHIIPRTYNPVKSVFTNKKYTDGKESLNKEWENIYPSILSLQSIINTKRASGLNVVLGLYGHEHSDLFFINNGVPEICVGSTVIDEYNNLSRFNGAKTSSVVVNLYEYDEWTNSLVVYRLGADSPSTGIPRKMLSFDYHNKMIVTQCGQE